MQQSATVQHISIGRRVATVAVCALVGPLIGMVVTFPFLRTADLVRALTTSDFVTAVVFSYMSGIVPALTTGVSVAWLGGHAVSRRLSVAVVSGVIINAVLHLALSAQAGTFYPAWSSTQFFAISSLCCLVAALACTWLTQRRA